MAQITGQKSVGIQENPPFISLKNIEKVYPNGEKAVYDFNLDIEKNEFIVIVGPSGCGKSTTLRMIAGLEDISSGDVFMEGELLNYKPCKDRRMAIVFQSYALYPQMSVYDNIAFPLTINKYSMPVVNRVLKACSEVEFLLENRNFGQIEDILGRKMKNRFEELAMIFDVSTEAVRLLDRFAFIKTASQTASLRERVDRILSDVANAAREEKKKLAEKKISVDENFQVLDENGTVQKENRKLTRPEIRRRVYETAEKLDLTPYLDKLPKELSGGQMQRVALGRAMIKNFPVFLMDEPLSNLDAKLRLTMRSEIVKLHNRIGATTVYVTHDQTEAMTMATRIVVMSRGFIQQIGSPQEIYNNPRNIFVAKFIGSPAMNLFEMEFDRTRKTLTSEGITITPGQSFLEAHDRFYKAQAERFTRMSQAFDQKAQERIVNLLSVLGEAPKRNKRSDKRGFFSRFVRKSAKPAAEEYAFEKAVCEEKRDRLTAVLDRDHPLTVGVRPESIRIELYDPKNKYDNGMNVKPTVCELLGGVYHIHFDYCGKNFVAQMDAKQTVTAGDELVVWFPAEDIYVFDPITGETIVY